MKTTFTLLSILLTTVIFAQEFKVAPEYIKQIEKLSKKKNIVAAMAHIDELEGVSHKDLIYLTEIPAPPFKESERATAFLKMLQEAGADKVWIDEVGNVIAIRKGTEGGKTIALDAHLDTVFPEGTDVTVKFKGDTLFAPGIGDDTRGLIVILTALRAMEMAGVETKADVTFIGTVGEEGLGDLRGVKHIFKKNDPKIDSWIGIDGGAIGRVNNKGLGSNRYKVTLTGPGGHSWGAFGLVNPHHALGKAIDIFSEAASKYTSSGPKTSFNVGRMGGGTSVNSIPFESWMEVDMRSVSPESLQEIDAIFQSSMKQALETYNSLHADEPQLEMKVEQIGSRPSGELSDDTPLVQLASAATMYFGEEPRLTRGSTNSNIPIARGIPAVTLGRGGDGGKAHSLGEWWMNTNGADAIKLAMLLVVAEAGLAK